MLDRLIRYSTSRPKRVIALWIVVAVALTALGGIKAYSVTTDDTAQFLPKDSESAQAVRYGQEAFGVQRGTSTVTVLLQRSDGAPLDAADGAAVGRLAAGMPRWRPDLDALKEDTAGIDTASRAGRIVAARVGPVADHGRFGLVAVQWKANTTDPAAQKAFRQFRDQLVSSADDVGLRAGFTGGVASVSDDMQAGESRQMVGQVLLFGSVLLLSALFLRGVLAAILPLLTILIVAGGATGLVVVAALLFGFELDQSTPQLITVVLLGVGVDYFLFLLFRLRERLRTGEGKRAAATSAATRVGPVIASAALAIVVAFATLGLAQFGQFRVLGPSVAISVLVMLFAGVTLMPAIVAVAGPKLFWPSKAWRTEPTGGAAARLGVAIARRPGRIALATTLVLVALAGAALATTMDYDLTGSGPDTAASRTADQIARTLPEGASDPQQVYVRSDAPLSADALAPLRRRLGRVEGVGTVSPATLTSDRRGARIDVALDVASTSEAGMDVARGPLRDAARRGAPEGTTAMVGGTAGVFADVADSIDHDLRLIFPVAAGLILLILVVMLRSVLAPLYLLAAVALEFAATLGATVLVFQTIGGASGVAFTLPLVLFLFVVALGTDYNILMTARLREEMLAGVSPRRAVADAVRTTAPTIAAAGLVLAACFATLILEADDGTRQMGFAMALGIMIAALVVSTVLVPAITALVGAKAWWPSRAASGSARRPEDARDRGRADRRRPDGHGWPSGRPHAGDGERRPAANGWARSAREDGAPRAASDAANPTTTYASGIRPERDGDGGRSGRPM